MAIVPLFTVETIGEGTPWHSGPVLGARFEQGMEMSDATYRASQHKWTKRLQRGHHHEKLASAWALAVSSIEHEGDRTIIDQRHSHVGLERSRLHLQSRLLE